ncbi:MAG TPA: MerR family transcriptional regulator [Candidatus Treponema faecavium]|nr:MerR family transcriptional regulator [Candidatus Treponema faecavium]
MTIAEVSRKYGLSADTLRYYERSGLIPPVQRTAGGIRNYTEEDCKWVYFSKCLRSAGMPVETIAAYVLLCQQGDETIPERINLLKIQKERLAHQLAELQANYDKLTEKIESYSEKLLKFEQSLAD